MEKTLNIVHLHVIYHRYFTGVDRYLEMYRRGMRSQSECDNVKIHTVFCTDDPKAVFPRIETSADGELSAVIPLPQQQKLIFEDVFWKARYMKVIKKILNIAVNYDWIQKNPFGNIRFHQRNQRRRCRRQRGGDRLCGRGILDNSRNAETIVCEAPPGMKRMA